MRRNQSSFWTFLLISIGSTWYLRPNSSSTMLTFCPLGVPQVYRVISVSGVDIVVLIELEICLMEGLVVGAIREDADLVGLWLRWWRVWMTRGRHRAIYPDCSMRFIPRPEYSFFLPLGDAPPPTTSLPSPECGAVVSKQISFRRFVIHTELTSAYTTRR